MDKFKVRNLINETYQVTVTRYETEYVSGDKEGIVFQGSLSDCEAYIRLSEGRYFD